MKLMRIKIINEDRLMRKFAEVQGKASARTIDSFKDLQEIVETISQQVGLINVRYDKNNEKHISSGFMTKKALEGTRATYDFRQTFPNAYKYRADSTQFEMIFQNGCWQIDVDSIKRDFCPNSSGNPYRVYLSDSAKKKIIEQYEQN